MPCRLEAYIVRYLLNGSDRDTCGDSSHKGDLHAVAACEPYGSVLVISLFKKTFCGEIIYISMGC